MKREAKYIAILGGLLLIFVLVQLFGPKPIDWTPTYVPTDKNPFGAYVASELLDEFFEGRPVEKNNLTLYELEDSIASGDNLLSISNTFSPDEAAVNVLFKKVDNGSHAFISAYYFSGKFADTLGLYTGDVFFDRLTLPGNAADTSDLKFVLPGTIKRKYYYRVENISSFFSTIDSLKADTYTISTNNWGKPVTIRIPWGKGYFVLNTTPLAFTNNYLLYEDNFRFAGQTLSFLPVAKTWWTSYYQIGRLESETPLRFILQTESLRWAYYIGIASLLLFALFESKRKQRIIPIISPLANTTLEFVKTIGNMYLQANDHKAIAEKKIAFFLDQIRSSFYLSGETGEALIQTVAKKSGNSLEKTQRLFSLIKIVQSSGQIPEPMLLELNGQIHDFMNSTQPKKRT